MKVKQLYSFFKKRNKIRIKWKKQNIQIIPNQNKDVNADEVMAE